MHPLCQECLSLFPQLEKLVHSDTICLLCGNFSTPPMLESFILKLKGALDSPNAPTFFSISISLSLCFAYRVIYILRSFQNLEREAIIEQYTLLAQSFKTVYRNIISSSVESNTGMKFVPNSPFRVDVCLFSQERSFLFLEQAFHAKYKDKTNLRKVWSKNPCSVADFACNAEMPSSLDILPSDFIISLSHAPLFIAGKYFKFKRNISQSPWLDTSTPSVSGYIEQTISEFFRPDRCKFSSAGREDIDVRMLGSGRPFLVEICNPKCFLPHSENFTKVPQILDKICRNVEETSSGNVSMGKKIFLVDGHKASKILKLGELDHPKRYNAVISSKLPLYTLECFSNVSLSQKTPIRVLHRRPNIIREKELYHVSVEPLYPNEKVGPFFIKMEVKTQAGTYIKEFVHGDLGRTKPSLGTLLFETPDACQLLELDVVEIEMAEWPPTDSILIQ